VNRGRVLVVAGSDSGAGAGIQADLKTVMALGGYATTAITALTAQNTLGVHGVLPVPPAFVVLQMRVVLDDIGADALKIGMLGTAEVIAAVADALPAGVPVVVDPVMVAKGGAPLLEPDAVDAMRTLLVSRAAVVTPNAPEAAALTGLTVADADGMRTAADALLRMGAQAVLMKGGHLPGAEVRDLLVTPTGAEIWAEPRIETRHTHGTGCTLASAVAVSLAQGMVLREAVARARAYVRAALAAAPGLGAGHGPMGHALVAPRAEA
jgi:hydroxymethylpyrimidine/phosphomethylpyrimidine kinase